MKKLIFVQINVFLLTLFITGVSLYADSDEEGAHGRPLEVILQEIRVKQGLYPDEAINPRKVGDEDLAELGEALMGVMHPDPRQHELMDKMMGGEGSESLASMHRIMGYRYLSGNTYPMMRGGMMNMMGGGMMGLGMMGGPVGYFSFWVIFMWIIILVVIGLVVYFIVRSAKNREGEMKTGYDTALDILKKRYARGEISKAEYEEIRKNL